MKKLDTYLSLCTQVYDISKPTPPDDAYRFYRHYVLNAHGPILEPMCGTGHFLLPFIQEGFDVHGFDASDHMLDELTKKASHIHLKPTVWKGFIEDLNSPTKYKLVFIPSGSFCLLTDLHIVKTALKTIYNQLTDDGTFVFEIETQASISSLGSWRGSKWKRNDGKVIIASFLTELHDIICSSIGKYELVDGNTIIQTEIEEYSLKIYSHDELIALLAEAGFQQVRAIRAYDVNSVPNKEDESVVYECRK